MKKNNRLFYVVLIFFWVSVSAPLSKNADDITLTGKIADQQNVGLSGKRVSLFLNGHVDGLTDTTDSEGRYAFSFTPSDIKHENLLPEGYELSNNYPNPFNPSTNINVTIPQATHVKIGVYDLLGQELGTIIDEYLAAGTYPIRIDLEKLINGRDVSEGIYFAKAVFDEKYTNVKKLLFLRDSQHAINTNFSYTSPATAGNVTISLHNMLQDIADSLKVSGRSILPKSVALNTILTGSTVDFGTTIVDSAFNVDGKIISTIRYNEPDNNISGVRVIISGYDTLTDSLGRFSLQVPTGDSLRNMDIEDPSMWLRQKKIYIHNDTSDVIEDVLTKNDFPDSVMNYLNKTSSRNQPYHFATLKRFINKPIFYIVADTTQQWDRDFTTILSTLIRGTLNDVTKSRKYSQGFLENVIIESGTNPPAVGTLGYYVIKTSMQYGNAVALTSGYASNDSIPEQIYCETIFGIYPQPDIMQIKRLMGHELASGIVYMPVRSDDLISWYNFGPPFSSANPSKTDTLMLRAIFSRDTGWDMYDTDWLRTKKNPFAFPP